MHLERLAPSILACMAILMAALALVLAIGANRRRGRDGRAPRLPSEGSARPDDGRRIAALEAEVQALRTANGALQERVAACLAAPGLLRFSAFGDAGPPLSFALALVDGHGNGAVVTSLFGRDASRTYAKPVSAGQSPLPLSEDEQEAIRRSWRPSSS